MGEPERSGALRVAVVVPPMSNLNTAYASLPRLAGWLRSLGHEVVPIDLSLQLFLRLFSHDGLRRIYDAVDPRRLSGDLIRIYIDRERYTRMIEDVVGFLQGQDASLATRLIAFLPKRPAQVREPDAQLAALFGTFGLVDRARFLATQVIQDVAFLIQRTIAPNFALTSYAERLAASATSFDDLAAELARPPTLVDEMLRECAERLVPADVALLALTCPFPGNLLGALRLGQWAATARPGALRALGGGYPSTELRELREPRVFDHVDAIVLDDGELPLARLCARAAGDRDAPLVRTFTREAGAVRWHDAPADAPRFRELPVPSYRDLDLGQYIQPLSTLNPVFRLGDEGPWLKLTAAHGCYWKKCTFCDIHLPYIADFDPIPAAALADQMDAMHTETGVRSFHFTDEAIPPPLLVNLALELLRRGRSYQYYGNIRFDPGFTIDRCRLLAASGLVAVTGGIEVASDALLARIAKGITVDQVIHVLDAFARAGVRTHAYLIYGFPGEGPQETIDSLELLRQMARAGVLQSGYFHHFTATAHAPVGRQPETFGIRLRPAARGGFAHYALDYEAQAHPPTQEWVFDALREALRAFARGEGLERDVRSWFTRAAMPAPRVAADFVETTRATPSEDASHQRVCWLGGRPFWANGTLYVADDHGEQRVLTQPAAVAEQLAWCQPTGWRTASGPKRGDFPDTSWFAALRPYGLVQV